MFVRTYDPNPILEAFTVHSIQYIYRGEGPGLDHQAAHRHPRGSPSFGPLLLKGRVLRMRTGLIFQTLRYTPKIWILMKAWEMGKRR